MSFQVELADFRGPLDLLLYLVRRHELAVNELPLQPIAEQFWRGVEEAAAADLDEAAEFLDLASTLIEIKSRCILPRVEEEVLEELGDPAHNLVARLLEYKRFRDVASMLEERSRQWQRRHTRTSNDAPRSSWASGDDQPVQGLELWDLVSAYVRLQAANSRQTGASIVFDETPIHVYMARIRDDLVQRQRISLGQLFTMGMHKSAMIGVFLAILELVRHHSVRTEQEGVHGEIWLSPGERFDPHMDFAALSRDNLEQTPTPPAVSDTSPLPR